MIIPGAQRRGTPQQVDVAAEALGVDDVVGEYLDVHELVLVVGGIREVDDGGGVGYDPPQFARAALSLRHL
jgi:hypothetical protein